MRSVAQKELSESGKQALQKEIQKVEQQTRNQTPIFPRPKGIPKDWEYQRTGKNDGDIYMKPGSDGETKIRFMKAKPDSPREGQRVNYSASEFEWNKFLVLLDCHQAPHKKRRKRWHMEKIFGKERWPCWPKARVPQRCVDYWGWVT
jgi:hypothetical protein